MVVKKLLLIASVRTPSQNAKWKKNKFLFHRVFSPTADNPLYMATVAQDTTRACTAWADASRRRLPLHTCIQLQVSTTGFFDIVHDSTQPTTPSPRCIQLSLQIETCLQHEVHNTQQSHALPQFLISEDFRRTRQYARCICRCSNFQERSSLAHVLVSGQDRA